jgi:hypothetical protein
LKLEKTAQVPQMQACFVSMSAQEAVPVEQYKPGISSLLRGVLSLQTVVPMLTSRSLAHLLIFCTGHFEHMH